MSSSKARRGRSGRILLVLVMVLGLAFSALPVLGQSADLEVPDDVVSAINAEKGEATYIVQMIDDPVVAYDGSIKGLASTKPKDGKKIDPDSGKVVKYVDYLKGKHNGALNGVGAGLDKKLYDYSYTFNGFAAKLTGSQAAAMAARNDVRMIWQDELMAVDTISTPDFLGLTDDGGAWEMGYTGENVIIGIVDSGIWPESLSFADRTGTNPNGTPGKLDYQQIPGWHGKCTPGDEFQADECNQKLIGAQFFGAGWGGEAGVSALFPYEYWSARDADGHGTHTASTAGGNGNVAAVVDGLALGSVSGMAPRARIASYKVCWGRGDAGGCFSSDSVAAIDQAVADGVDVINFSISGTRTNFLDPVEVAFLFAEDAGVFVAASAGNAGPTAATVAHPSPWITTVAAGTHDRYSEATVTLGNGDSYVGASFQFTGVDETNLVYSADVGLAGEDPTQVRLCYPGTLDAALVDGNIVVCDRGTIARVDKSLAVAMAGGAGMVHANVSPSSINADLHSVPTVHVDHIDGAAIRAYAQTADATASISPATPVTIEAPDVASFSSRGPLQGSSDLLKPDIMAPGQDIIAAVSPAGYNGRNFDSLSGTSMSSPHIAGLAAVVKSAHPDWSPTMIKSALMTTASQLTNEENPIPGDPFDYGSGHVAPNSALDPGLVYDAGWVDWLGFLCGTGQLQASYCPLIGIDPSDLNQPNITIGELAGTQTVERRVTNVAGGTHTYAVSVDEPFGVDVVVSPDELTLAPGETGIYEVTFTTTDTATIGDYAFGSLTWSHGPHAVRSVLTVRAVQAAVPGEVFGSGTDGSLEFSIVFGYNGDYFAQPHGLVAATMTDGTVLDDPGNSFAPFGPGTTLHFVTVPAGSALARFSLFDDYTDGNDDLDLYVFYPGGSFAGGSGSGTSAEEVNVLFPPAGDYYVFVHGWQTDGPDSRYTLFDWSVPATPGSTNMTVTGPTTATLGDTYSIQVDWVGLDPDTKYLGAVSHSETADLSGLFDLTVVRVDTD
ncbi:MAG: S8 family peptidase [Acidimicrobiia bacterium]|nr:S8 family peptidase [Acidimicrobiia bacterium]